MIKKGVFSFTLIFILVILFFSYSGMSQSNIETQYLNEEINDQPPVLAQGEVTPTSGDTDMLFTFEVIYTDSDNDAPKSVFVVINGTASIMKETDTTDTNFSDGKVYTYQTKLEIGTIDYYFECSNENIAYKVRFGSESEPYTIDVGKAKDKDGDGGTVTLASSPVCTILVIISVILIIIGLYLSRIIGKKRGVIPTPKEIDDYIQRISMKAFSKEPEKVKEWFSKKLNKVEKLIKANNYKPALNILKSEIRPRMDGEPKPKDWIRDKKIQNMLCEKLDEIIEDIERRL
jgi:hypothetical protein